MAVLEAEVRIEQMDAGAGLMMNSPKSLGEPMPVPKGFKAFKDWCNAQPDKAFGVEAERSAYRDLDDNLCVTTLCLMASLREACKETPCPKGLGNPRASIAKYLARAVKVVGTKHVTTAVLVTPKGKPITNYKVDVRPAVIQSSRILRARPYIEGWAADFLFQMDQEFFALSDEDWRDQWNKAGRCGVCDQRPTAPKKPGPYGTYKVTKWKVNGK